MSDKVFNHRAARALYLVQQNEDAPSLPEADQQVLVFRIVPFPAPRQSQSEKWRPTQRTIDYRRYCDELRMLFRATGLKALPAAFDMTFELPVSPSWSEKKKQSFLGLPHKHKPDVDNLLKGFMDAFRLDDSHVHSVVARKIWAREGKITLQVLEP